MSQHCTMSDPQCLNTYIMSWYIVTCVNTTQCPDLCSTLHNVRHTTDIVLTPCQPTSQTRVTTSQCQDTLWCVLNLYLTMFCPIVNSVQDTLWQCPGHFVAVSRTLCGSVQDTLWQCPGHLNSVQDTLWQCLIRDLCGSCVHSIL